MSKLAVLRRLGAGLLGVLRSSKVTKFAARYWSKGISLAKKTGKWMLKPMTKYGKTLSNKVAGRVVLGGRKLQAYAAAHPQVGRLLKPIAEHMTNHSFAAIVGDLAVAAGLDLVITGGVAAIDLLTPDDPVVQRTAEALDLDPEDDFDVIQEVLRLANTPEFLESYRIMTGDQTQPLTSQRDWRAKSLESDVANALVSYVLYGDGSALKALASKLTGQGFLLLASRIMGAHLVLLNGATVNEYTKTLAMIRAYQTLSSDGPQSIGVSKACAQTLLTPTEDQIAAASFALGSLNSSVDGLATMIVDQIKKEFDTFGMNLSALFTSDERELQKVQELANGETGRFLAALLGSLDTFDEIRSFADRVNVDKSDEEECFALAALSEAYSDVDGDDISDASQRDTKTAQFYEFTKSGVGSKLERALFDS